MAALGKGWHQQGQPPSSSSGSDPSDVRAHQSREDGPEEDTQTIHDLQLFIYVLVKKPKKGNEEDVVEEVWRPSTPRWFCSYGFGRLFCGMR